MYDFKPPYFGTSYYPESWDRSEIDADLDRIISHGLNTVRIAEFAWYNIEPSEGVYDFSLFREVVDKCKARGISVVMCTPSATPPAWMAHKYPEIFAFDGLKRSHHGSRRKTCPSSKLYRRLCANIVEELAKEFANDENVIGWQVDNELNTMVFGNGCSCPECTQGFRDFLKGRYGTIDALNDAWGHYTWSMAFESFDEIEAYTENANLAAVHKYMWEQYKSLMTSDFCRAQADILRKYTEKPIGTDMMPTHQLDPAETNSHLSVSQLNQYSGPTNQQFWLEYYGSLHNRPMWLTETSTCWNGGNNPPGSRRKGFCKANTLMSFSSGGEMALYWLFRSHRGGYEMTHGSVVDAWGRDMQCSDEVRAISKTLDNLRPMVQGTRPKKSGMAISFFHAPYVIDKYASFETASVRVPYTDDITGKIYRPLMQRHFRPDVISANADLTPYKLIISHRQLTLEEGDFLDKIMPWVENGGTWVAGPYTDIVTNSLAKYKNAPYGHLEDWAKVTRAYYIPAPGNGIPSANGGNLPEVEFEDGRLAVTTNNLSYDAIVPHDGVRVIAKYKEGTEYLEGYAAITETKVGKGRIILMGVQLEPNAFADFITSVAEECGITPIAQGSGNVQVNLLEGEYGTVFTAIECRAASGKISIPFDCVDIDTEKEYTSGEEVEIAPYECIFAKKK